MSSETTDHVHLDLRDDEGNPHRPDVSVYVEFPDEGEPLVVLQLGMMMGQPLRWAEFSYDEARHLVNILQDALRRSRLGPDPLPEGVVAVSLEDPAELHNTLKQIIGD